MSKFAAIVVTAAVCLPLGALIKSAVAERRMNHFSRGYLIEGHRHLSRAQAALHEALEEMKASERSDELLWSDTTGRASETRAAVERAVLLFDGTADWVRNGMAQQGLAGPTRRLNVPAPKARP